MFEVLQIFYKTHYNFAAVSVLLFMLLIFMLSKKNIKVALIALTLLLVFNVFIFKKTDGKAWTIELDAPPAQPDAYGYVPLQEPQTMTFSVKKNWTITDEKGEVHHWCWVDTYWDKFANTDLVAAIWGENSSKKMTKASESHADNSNE